MSVREAQQKIDSAEFSEWIAFHSQEPFTFNTTEKLLADIACMIGNMFSKPGAKTLKPDHFLPTTTPVKREDSKSMEMKLRAFFKV